MHLIDLKSDNLVCRIAPEMGGAIYSFDYVAGKKKQHLMRPASNESEHRITEFASWPLVPYSNRIDSGKFNFGGVDYRVPITWIGPPHHASHGHGWERPWEIKSRGSKQCDLVLHFSDKFDWPFPYKAEQSFKLDDQGLGLHLTVTNIGTVQMPAGLGLHPYFPRTKGSTLQAKTGKLWEIDKNTLPSKLVRPPRKWTFAKPQSLDNAVGLDNCFEGYGGVMEIVWPGQPMKLRVKSSENLGHFVVYVPEGKDFFCAEPVSHMPNAINRMKKDKTTGLVLLNPGETLSADYRFEAVQAAGDQSQSKRPSMVRKNTRHAPAHR